MNFEIKRNVTIGTETAEAVMISRDQNCEIISIRHKRDFGPALGGTRFVTQGSIEETFHLAKGMSEKCLACFVPVDGFKTLVITPDGIPDEKLRAKLLAYHIKKCVSHEPDLIFGPDMGSPESVMKVALVELGMDYKNITGLPNEVGGLDIDKNGFTAYGVWQTIRQLQLESIGPYKVSIQGYGEVGSYLSDILFEEKYSVIGLSNILGTLIQLDGINIAELRKFYDRSKEDCLRHYLMQGNDVSGSYYDSPNRLFKINTDIFIPAARTTSFACQDEIYMLKHENPNVYSIERFLHDSETKVIVEAANHPLTYKAEKYAEEIGVLVLPDFIVNCGGMIGCYLEWRYREKLLNGDLNYTEVVSKVRNFIETTIVTNMKALLFDKFKMREKANELILTNREKLVTNQSVKALQL